MNAHEKPQQYTCMHVEKIGSMEEIKHPNGAQARNKYMQKRIGIEKLVLQHVRDFFPLLFHLRALRKGSRRSSGIFFAGKTTQLWYEQPA